MAIKEQNTEKLTTEEVTKLNELRITSSELTFERGQVGIFKIFFIFIASKPLAGNFFDIYINKQHTIWLKH